MATKLTRASELKSVKFKGISTTFSELDTLFSFDGGVPEENLVFVTGTSGAGKTTLMCTLQSALKHIPTAQYQRESSAEKVKSRNKNLNFHSNFYLCDEKTNPTLEDFLNASQDVKIVVIDSLQACSMDYSTETNAVIKVFDLVRQWIKKTGGIAFLIGHVTKEDEFAGSNALMQYSDSHLELIFDKEKNERFMRFGGKNRDGEVGKKLFYNFIGDGRGICFPKQVRQSTIDVMRERLATHVKSYSGSPGYKEFLKELRNRQKGVLDMHEENPTMFIAEMIVVCDELIEKFGL